MRRRAIAIIAVVGAGFALLTGTAWVCGLRLNLTPSEPLGLWRIKTLQRSVTVGDLVFICPPVTSLFNQALERGYLRRGLCPGGRAPLIKTVAALPNQSIEVAGLVTIDGEVLDHSVVRDMDGKGRTLAAFQGGIVPADHLFLHSDFAGSYDSRYFGPVPDSGLLGLARPVLTFGQ